MGTPCSFLSSLGGERCGLALGRTASSPSELLTDPDRRAKYLHLTISFTSHYSRDRRGGIEGRVIEQAGRCWEEAIAPPAVLLIVRSTALT